LEAPPEGAKLLAYAPFLTPCRKLNCSIYDIDGRPLQPRVIQVTAGANKIHINFLLLAVALQLSILIRKVVC